MNSRAATGSTGRPGSATITPRSTPMAAASRISASSRGVSTPAARSAMTAESSASRTGVWASGRRIAPPSLRPRAPLLLAGTLAVLAQPDLQEHERDGQRRADAADDDPDDVHPAVAHGGQ